MPLTGPVLRVAFRLAFWATLIAIACVRGLRRLCLWLASALTTLAAWLGRLAVRMRWWAWR